MRKHTLGTVDKVNALLKLMFVNDNNISATPNENEEAPLACTRSTTCGLILSLSLNLYIFFAAVVGDISITRPLTTPRMGSMMDTTICVCADIVAVVLGIKKYILQRWKLIINEMNYAVNKWCFACIL